MIIPYNSPSVSEGSAEYNALLLGKTNIAGFIFDAFLAVNHRQELKVTEHPVETGAAISDHAYIMPAELRFEVGMSDAMTSVVNGQFDSSWSRSRSAWDILKEIQASRIPLTALTRLGRYENLLITSLEQNDDYRTVTGLRATVVCKQILTAQVKMAAVSAQPQITDETQAGQLQVQELEDVSILYGTGTAIRDFFANWFGGGTQ